MATRCLFVVSNSPEHRDRLPKADTQPQHCQPDWELSSGSSQFTTHSSLLICLFWWCFWVKLLTRLETSLSRTAPLHEHHAPISATHRWCLLTLCQFNLSRSPTARWPEEGRYLNECVLKQPKHFYSLERYSCFLMELNNKKKRFKCYILWSLVNLQVWGFGGIFLFVLEVFFAFFKFHFISFKYSVPWLDIYIDYKTVSLIVRQASVYLGI